MATTAAAHAQLPSGNIFLGYSYARADMGLGDHINANGFEGSLEGKVFPHLGIVADVSGHYNEKQTINICPGPGPCSAVPVNATLHSYLAGPRVSVSIGRFTPFANALFGVSHIKASASGFAEADTAFATAIGGGVDYKLIKGFAVRVQADALQTRFFGQTQNNLRAAAGVVFRF